MPGPQQTKDLVDGYLAGICRVSGVPGRAFGGRITESLMPPEEYKGIQEMYAKIGGPPGTWDNLNRLDCLRLGKEIHAAKRA